MASANLEKGIVDLLERVIDSKIENFEVKVHDGNEKGEGFIGEIIFVSLKNKKDGEELNLIVKRALPHDESNNWDMITAAFRVEIYYYAEIFPALINFQKSYPEVEIFENFPKCYATTLERRFEKLAIENLKFKNFQAHPKHLPVDPASYEKIFKMYGEFHALTLAFKKYHPEHFFKVKQDLGNNWVDLLEKFDPFKKYLTFMLKRNLQMCKEEGEENIAKKLDSYLEDVIKITTDSIANDDSCDTILHGDCWSNNMMFKYNSSRDIEQIKMIDFQMGFVGSPAIDLSYSLYAGAGKESLDCLESLLKLYHNSLSETLKKYGCDPDIIYTYEMLKKEWKKHCRFGFLMGILGWVTKSATDFTDTPSTTDLMEKQTEVPENIFQIKYNEEAYTKVVLDLCRHMNDNDFL